MERKSKLKDLMKRFRGEIFVGIIVSAIWWFMERIADNAPMAGKTILGTIQNLIYSCASSISTDSILIILLAMGTGFIIIVGIIPFVFRIIDKKNEKEILDFEKTVNRINKLDSEIREYSIETEIDNEKIQNFRTEIEKCQTELSRYNSNKLYKTISTIISIVFSVLYLGLMILTDIIPIYILNDFNRDIKMIKPYADNKTIIMLESDWTRMKGKDDYEKIYDTINQIKEENNLPKK